MLLCVKNVRIQVLIFPHSDYIEYGEKIRTRKTHNMDTFYAVLRDDNLIIIPTIFIPHNFL